MDMCENLLSRGYLTVCDNTFIWTQVAIVIFIFFITTLVVILFIKNNKLKQKQNKLIQSIEGKVMTDRTEELLSILSEGDEELSLSSSQGLNAILATQQVANKAVLQKANEVNITKQQSRILQNALQEIESLENVNQVLLGELDQSKLSILCSELHLELPEVILLHGNAGQTYLDDNQKKVLYTDLCQYPGCKESFTEMGITNDADIQKLPNYKLEEFFYVLAEMDVTEQTYKTMGLLIIAQVENSKITDAKRKVLMSDYATKKAELQKKKDFLKSSDVVNDAVTKSLGNDVGKESNETESTAVTKESTESSEQLSNDNAESGQEINDKLSETVDSEPGNDQLFLSEDDDSWLSKKFNDIPALRYKINEWKIELKQPIDFYLIGTERVQVLVEIAATEKRSHPLNPDFTKVHELLSSVLEKM